MRVLNFRWYRSWFILITLITGLVLYGQISLALDKALEHELYYVTATYTTYFDPADSNRVQNIKLAAEKLDGTFLKPGEVFSFNQQVGPRTKERGFKEALEIVDGEFVDGVGGGVCQVSSTLYNSVLLANLELVERRAHSRPVSYVDLGRGATVYYQQLDFKFKNDNSSPLMIMARTKKRRITVSILGREAGPQVEIATSISEVLEPEVEKEVVTDELTAGEQKVLSQGQKGYKVEVKRIVKEEGQIIKKEIISKDIYSPKPRIIKIHPEE